MPSQIASMTSPLTGRYQGRANTALPKKTSPQWQPSAPASQSHIRPGADLTLESKDSPDKLLIRFLRSNETYEVSKPNDPKETRKTSQGVLREILDDERWDRHIVEEFYKEINPSVKGLQSCLTPYPFHRTLYLMLLNALEDKEKLIKERGTAGGPAIGFGQAEMATLEDQARKRIAQDHAGQPHTQT